MKEKINLRTIDGLTEAIEWLFEQQQTNKIDAKTADAMNTTIKGAIYLRGKLRLDAAKIILQAQIKKVNIPQGMLPE